MVALLTQWSVVQIHSRNHPNLYFFIRDWQLSSTSRQSRNQNLRAAASFQRSAVSSLLTEAVLGHHSKFTHLIFC